MNKVMPSKLQQSIHEYMAKESSTYFRNLLDKMLAEDDQLSLTESFSSSLEFGTGGIRGIIGPGTNRLNNCIVEGIADGWARYLIAHHSNTDSDIKVVIAYDSRHFSQTFAHTLTEVMAAYGIIVYCYTEPRPTPQLSYTIRQLKAQSGAVITASHNPPAYNGIKIYWSEGQQIVSPHDAGIIQSIADSVYPIQRCPIDTCRQKKLLVDLKVEQDLAFRDYVCSQIDKKFLQDHGSGLKIVYTPLHGTGGTHMSTLAKSSGLDLIVEPSQAKPDGDFPTVKFPNPEDPKALFRAIKTAQDQRADLVVATDPDADRVGVAVRSSGDFVLLTGNQTGALLLDFAIRRHLRSASLPAKPYFINTIVTSELQDSIARAAGIKVVKTYTGFKNIALAIEENGEEGFVFSGEESFGYLPDPRVRDKDGISSAMLVINLALELKMHNRSLIEQLDILYKTYGYHNEHTINGVFEGIEGKERISQIMDTLRRNPPAQFASHEVTSISDFSAGTTVDSRTGKQTRLTLPKGNVLIYHLAEGNKLCVRPSGTEPKIKFYLLFKATDLSADLDVQKSELQARLDRGTQEVNQWIK